ncbi:preprotein translocase subunit SecG [Legionella sp. W05-934-2]|jgi:preprotein translocase subunit SecG|uniref:preprotein translocase subunit SecG n=1 Tax=Legionella sp. W05-934-2 TaxID=1198649 RepID=UPI00346185E7
MYQLVLITHVFIAVVLIGLVLIQHGKGADIGAAFGSGASNTVFGSQGSGGFLFKLTGSLAIGFFVTSLTLSYLVSSDYNQGKKQALPAQNSQVDQSLPAPAE